MTLPDQAWRLRMVPMHVVQPRKGKYPGAAAGALHKTILHDRTTIAPCDHDLMMMRNRFGISIGTSKWFAKPCDVTGPPCF
jgi:hypothetical protein